MGRTQHTYRMRLQQVRDRLLQSVPDHQYRQLYRKLWIPAHTLSAPGSTMPHPDTLAVATFSMLLEAISRIQDIKDNNMRKSGEKEG